MTVRFRRLVGVALASIILSFAGTSISPATPVGATESDATESDATESDATGSDAESEVDEAEVQLVLDGAEVYSQICSACHQPGGVGLPGQYPPLIDNPNVDDADYVADVINNGRQGEIVVNGETYDGIMPAFSTLSDDDVEAVIAYIQNDFQTPEGEAAAAEPTGPVAGTELPGLAGASSLLAYLIAAVGIGMVLAPRFASTNDRLDTPWFDAWLKTAGIVICVVVLTVYIPDWVLKTGAVSKLSRFAQDLIGSTVWALGFVILLAGLWYLHREDKI